MAIWTAGATDDVPQVGAPRPTDLRVLLLDPTGGGARVLDQVLSSFLPVTTRLLFRRQAAAPGVPSGGAWADNVFGPPTGWAEAIPAGTATLWGCTAILPGAGGVPMYTGVGALGGGLPPVTTIGAQAVTLTDAAWLVTTIVIPPATDLFRLRVDLQPVRGVFDMSGAQLRTLVAAVDGADVTAAAAVPLTRAYYYDTAFDLTVGLAAGNLLAVAYAGDLTGLGAFTVAAYDG